MDACLPRSSSRTAAVVRQSRPTTTPRRSAFGSASRHESFHRSVGTCPLLVLTGRLPNKEPKTISTRPPAPVVVVTVCATERVALLLPSSLSLPFCHSSGGRRFVCSCLVRERVFLIKSRSGHVFHVMTLALTSQRFFKNHRLAATVHILRRPWCDHTPPVPLSCPSDPDRVLYTCPIAQQAKAVVMRTWL